MTKTRESFDSYLKALKSPRDKRSIEDELAANRALVEAVYSYRYQCVMEAVRQAEIKILEAEDGIFDKKTGQLKADSCLYPVGEDGGDLPALVSELAFALAKFDPIARQRNDNAAVNFLSRLIQEVTSQLELRADNLALAKKKKGEWSAICKRLPAKIKGELQDNKPLNERSWTPLRRELYSIFKKYLPPQVPNDHIYFLMEKLMVTFYPDTESEARILKHFSLEALRRHFHRNPA